MLASIASPVASYALMEFSEPVQAAALTAALTLAFTAASAVHRLVLVLETGGRIRRGPRRPREEQLDSSPRPPCSCR